MSEMKHTPGPCPHCGTEMENCGAPLWEDFCPNRDCAGLAKDFARAVRDAHIAYLDRERVRDAAPELLAAAKEFVRKVESGEARSKRSYAAFKAAIDKAEGR